ncbi:hypothetical protein SteCoe_11648 [Stentor coeruleus]|uniref:Uncharacterized protein n=1 Tax=Stentor coeruleus TaxID=5963 RepID=A0A1R2CCU1_9CILI|nr:hypothetical protein SteCoe_11648 [Stentor coeruleus]
MSILGRRFASHIIEYPGNIFAASWVLVPQWNIYGAEKGYNHVLESFREVEKKFPDGAFHVGEFCSVSCKNTLHIVSKLAKDLRTRSQREIVDYPTLLPVANWNEFFKVALSPEYYGTIPNFFMTARPGSIWKRLFPNESLHFIYANHSFMPLSKMRVADDTIWPTFSEDPQVINELKETAIKDLDTLLTLRHAELKKGGRFCFDVLLECKVPKESPWKQLNEVVQSFVDSGRIKKEERDKLALRNFERNDEIINTVLSRHEKNFRVVVKERMTSRFPAWSEYEKDKDANKLAKNYTDWLKEWTALAILNTLSATRPQEERNKIVSDIYAELQARCSKYPIPLDVNLYDFIVEKI